MKNTIETLFARTEQSPTGCKVWKGWIAKHGYGMLSIDGNKQYVHRLVWAHHHGPIPPKMFVCHRCDNTACCNIDHLFLGTQAENNSDMYIKNRGMHGENHYQTKLTWDAITDIRASPMRGADMARKYGVSKAIISDIRLGKTWREDRRPANFAASFVKDSNGVSLTHLPMVFPDKFPARLSECARPARTYRGKQVNRRNEEAAQLAAMHAKRVEAYQEWLRANPPIDPPTTGNGPSPM